MSEVLVQFDEPQRAKDGREFVAQVCGQRMPEGLWEAWIQFSPTDGGDPVATGRATEQLSRGDLRFWAAGLTRAYLAAALDKALSPQGSWQYAAAPSTSLPYHSEVASGDLEHMVLETNALMRPRPVFDPFLLYARGEYALRQELRQLDAPRLRDIILAYDIPDTDVAESARTFEDALAERIVAGVQQRVGKSPPSLVQEAPRIPHE
jgi:hypothetical protein